MMLYLVGGILLVLIIKEGIKLMRHEEIIYKDILINNRTVLVQYGCILIVLLLVSRAFHIRWPYVVLLFLISGIVLLHVLKVLNDFDTSYHDIMQLILFMTHLSHQFKTHQKIEFALEEVKTVCDEDLILMIDLILQSIEEGRYHEAFDLYNSHYLLKTLVTTMAHAQHQGDDNIMQALTLIEQDIDDLNNHIFIYISKMVALRNRILLLTCFGLVVSFVSQNMLNMVVDLTSMTLYQDVVFIFMISIIVLLGASFNIMKMPLIMEEEMLH